MSEADIVSIIIFMGIPIGVLGTGLVAAATGEPIAAVIFIIVFIIFFYVMMSVPKLSM